MEKVTNMTKELKELTTKAKEVEKCICGCHKSESSNEEMKLNGCDICYEYEHPKTEIWKKEFISKFVNDHGFEWRPLRGLWPDEVMDYISKLRNAAHQAGRDEMKKECLAAVPEQKHTLEEVSELNKNLPSTLQEQSYSESKGWIACREQTINNINAINTSIKEIESK